MRAQSQQATLDGFFGSLNDLALPLRGVSDRAFARAREQLHMPALAALNDFVIDRAEAAGMVPRWCGLRLVAADGSVLMPAVRPSPRMRHPAAAEQRLFALYLPGAELTLHAAVFGAKDAERLMLAEALERLGPDDLLLLDRGYPAAWLVALLDKHGIRFCIRCDNDSGWTAVREFIRSGTDEAWVTLNAPTAAEDEAWGCGRAAPRVRLVRQIAPQGAIRVLATNLTESQAPCETFGDLYHGRWRIEEAYKRLKHRMKLECVSGLSQQAVIIDVAAKVLADNLASLMCAAAGDEAGLATRSRRCNRSYAAMITQRAMPRLILTIGNWVSTLRDTIRELARNTQCFVAGRSRPRPPNPIKPHPSICYKA